MRYLLLIFFNLVFSLIHAQQYFPQRNQWEIQAPKDHGFIADSVKAAVDFAMAHEYTGSRDLRIAILKGFAREPFHQILGPTKKRGGPAGLIIKDGYIVASWGDVSRVDMTFSVTKSYLSTVAGLAVDEGLIQSVDDPVANYVWDGTFDGEYNAKVQWKHLLTQSSDWSGELFGVKDWADRPPREGGIDEWKYRELKEPGTFFEYNDVRVNVLAYSLLQVWRKSLPSVLKEHVMDPIGASTTWRWYGYNTSFTNVDGVMTQSVSGGGHSGGGVFINTLDHARFGLLFCRNGKWNGKEVLSESWVKAVQESSPANESYGFMWWLNRGNRTWEGVPSYYYYAAGFGGNFIVIDQKNDMVVVTRWLNPPDMEKFMQKIANSLKK
ncbi:MAG: beta-lactamase family protein [Bacteroidia bacterium]|nr:beta-lactamase family protein [Bacteroidia bacterium]